MIALLTLAAGLAGCDQQERADAGMRAAPAVEHPMLPGVPLPSGFSAVNDKTFATEVGRMRIAHYEFTGSAGRDAVHEFFLHQMPAAGFKLVQRGDEAGVYYLRFQSQTEEADLRIGRRSLAETYFVVDLRPRPEDAVRASDEAPPPPRRRP